MGSGFTLLFEALVMMMAKAMPIKSIAKIVNEHDTRLWRVLDHYLHVARREADFSTVTEVGVDETSSKRGHRYVSLFVDLEMPRVLFATEGKDATTLARFETDLEAHHGDPAHIQEVCCDMSPAFIKGVEKHFPRAHLTFDKFHVLKVLNEAVDEVRRQEQQVPSRAEKDQVSLAEKSLESQRESSLNAGSASSQEAESQNGPRLPPSDELPRVLEPTPACGRSLLEEMVFLGHPQPPGAHQRGCLYGKASLGWHSQMVYVKNQQRYPRRDQQPHPSCQSQASGISYRT